MYSLVCVTDPRRLQYIDSPLSAHFALLSQSVGWWLPPLCMSVPGLLIQSALGSQLAVLPEVIDTIAKQMALMECRCAAEHYKGCKRRWLEQSIKSVDCMSDQTIQDQSCGEGSSNRSQVLSVSLTPRQLTPCNPAIPLLLSVRHHLGGAETQLTCYLLH